jgi:hypothetical protein
MIGWAQLRQSVVCDAITAESGNQRRRLAFDTDDATID